jgi:hypothetical protein
VRCRTCDRPARHWDWFRRERALRVHWTVPTCSRVCLEIWKERRMVDPNEHEVAAMRRAGDAAGEFIEALGRTDMATWSPAEWTSFIDVICGGYVDSLIEQQIAINAAASKVQGLPG